MDRGRSANLGVGVVCGLEADMFKPHLAEEDLHEADEVCEGQVAVCDDTLDLVELCKMRGIDRLVPEDPIDTEVAGRGRSAVRSLL